MTLALLLGAGVGMGLWLVARGIFPTRPRLADALAALRRVPEPPPVLATADPGGPAARIGSPLATLLARGDPARLLWGGVRRDLAVLERSPGRHLAEKTALGMVGLLVVPAMAGLLALGGTALPVVVPLWGALVLGMAGFFVPDLGIHAAAEARRRDFRHALGAYLDLVVVALAGGGGVETALADAASVGQGFAFTHLRRALDQARLARQAPWGTLGRLGTELGVSELTELAASVSLAGTEGAKVRASLAAKAASLRSHQLAAAETEAEATTERMSLPVVLLFAGFLFLIGYPAIERVATGL